jgi:hypothetical protein
MSDSIEETLRELDVWFRDFPGGSQRPKFLAKLAMLEFCGWLELRMDDIVREAARRCGAESSWVEENLIGKTSGFKYNEHFRPMLCSVLGHGCVGRIESRLDQQNGGDVEQLKSTLGTLWNMRGSLAHTHFAGMTKQMTLNAPSWCKILTKYECVVVTVADAVGKMR